MMNTDNSAACWDRQPPWRLAAHPHFRDQSRQTTIPIRLFGDDVLVGQSQSLQLMLWCSSAAFKLPPMLARLTAPAMPMRNTTAASFKTVYSILVWSLSVMARGVFPIRDHTGAEWPVGSIRRRRGEAAMRIAGDLNFICLETSGDWKWKASDYKLPWKWNTNEMCHKCRADLRPGALDYKSVASTVAHADEEAWRTTATYFDVFD